MSETECLCKKEDYEKWVKYRPDWASFRSSYALHIDEAMTKLVGQIVSDKLFVETLITEAAKKDPEGFKKATKEQTTQDVFTSEHNGTRRGELNKLRKEYKQDRKDMFTYLVQMEEFFVSLRPSFLPEDNAEQFTAAFDKENEALVTAFREETKFLRISTFVMDLVDFAYGKFGELMFTSMYGSKLRDKYTEQILAWLCNGTMPKTFMGSFCTSSVTVDALTTSCGMALDLAVGKSDCFDGILSLVAVPINYVAGGWGGSCMGFFDTGTFSLQNLVAQGATYLGASGWVNYVSGWIQWGNPAGPYAIVMRRVLEWLNSLAKKQIDKNYEEICNKFHSELDHKVLSESFAALQGAGRVERLPEFIKTLGTCAWAPGHQAAGNSVVSFFVGDGEFPAPTWDLEKDKKPPFWGGFSTAAEVPARILQVAEVKGPTGELCAKKQDDAAIKELKRVCCVDSKGKQATGRVDVKECSETLAKAKITEELAKAKITEETKPRVETDNCEKNREPVTRQVQDFVSCQMMVQVPPPADAMMGMVGLFTKMCEDWKEWTVQRRGEHNKMASFPVICNARDPKEQNTFGIVETGTKLMDSIRNSTSVTVALNIALGKIEADIEKLSVGTSDDTNTDPEKLSKGAINTMHEKIKKMISASRDRLDKMIPHPFIDTFWTEVVKQRTVYDVLLYGPIAPKADKNTAVAARVRSKKPLKRIMNTVLRTLLHGDIAKS